jgi:hypothetical protein
MIKESELYTQVLQAQLKPAQGGEVYGTAYVRYEVHQVIDVRDLTEVRCYSITCTQRLVIPNVTKFQLSPLKDASFKLYPALLSSQFSLKEQPGAKIRLTNYSPRTVNTTITGSTSQGKGENQSTSRQHTSGSSTSETNTYGTSASLGFFGEAPTGGLSFDYSHSSTSEQSRSSSLGRERGSSTEQGESNSMSLKDWAGYAQLDTGNTTPTWVWGQEYPWDLIQYRYEKGGKVRLPKFVEQRMFSEGDDGKLIVLPPSQLSLFGIDFTMKASWLVELPRDIALQTASVSHTMQYLRASHELDSEKPSFKLDVAPLEFKADSPLLDLTLLGLDPIQDGSAGNGAVIGFIKSKFASPPPNAGSKFKIISEDNTLQVSGSGFDAPMLTTFASGEVKLTAQFKIVDTRYDYALFMKHWKTTDRGCTLEFVFNKNEKVIRHVDWNEGEGGEENLSSIVMRNRDYTTIDYHDYLVMGLNTVEVTIKPDEGTGSAGYILRALAIGVQ